MASYQKNEKDILRGGEPSATVEDLRQIPLNDKLNEEQAYKAKRISTRYSSSRRSSSISDSRTSIITSVAQLLIRINTAKCYSAVPKITLNQLRADTSSDQSSTSNNESYTASDRSSTGDNEPDASDRSSADDNQSYGASNRSRRL
ncbi:hypothetical protein MRB53_041712 [Persea americana]|nr:hypothetical protein MRB53_041712 [Persea americana]